MRQFPDQELWRRGPPEKPKKPKKPRNGPISILKLLKVLGNPSLTLFYAWNLGFRTSGGVPLALGGRKCQNPGFPGDGQKSQFSGNFMKFMDFYFLFFPQQWWIFLIKNIHRYCVQLILLLLEVYGPPLASAASGVFNNKKYNATKKTNNAIHNKWNTLLPSDIGLKHH